MNAEIKRFLFIAILTNCWIIYNSVLSQAQSDSRHDPLFESLQKHTDSTIVLHYISNWISPPSYYILSKKDNILNAYTYRDQAADFGSSPIISDIKKEMRRTYEFKIINIKPDINQFFHYYPLRPKEILNFWKEIKVIQPWLLEDDSKYGKGCHNLKPKMPKSDKSVVYDYNIYDGGGIKLYLISKDQIKVLNYYAPDYYQEVCPGRKDREAILKIAGIFKSYIL